MQQVKEYYGDYKQPATGKLVYVYILETYTEKELDQLYEQLLHTVSAQYAHVPDIATIEKTYKDMHGIFYGDPHMIATDLEDMYTIKPGLLAKRNEKELIDQSESQSQIQEKPSAGDEEG